MAAFVQQFSAHSETTLASTTITVPAGGVAVGHSLVLSAVTVQSTTPITSISGSDTRGNTYSFLGAAPVTATSSGVGMLVCNVTTALQAGDIITLTPNLTTTRMAISVHEYDQALTADVQSFNDNGAVSASFLTSGATTTTSSASELVVGAFALISSGRIFTTGSGYLEGTKVVTTAASGNRAIIAEYKFVSSTGTQTATGTLDSGSVYVGMVQTFSFAGGGGSRTGNPKVWDGSAWVAHPAKTWDGSAWVAHKAKGWDGSSWIESK